MTDSVALPGNPTCERAGGSITRAAVYTELESLLPVVRKQFRPMFSYRWGLEGNGTHTLTATAEFVGRSTEETAAALERCVTNLAIAAHDLELPAIRQMLGPDRTLWPKHAYEQAERWSNLVSRAAEARLFLALGGVELPLALPVVGAYMQSIGRRPNVTWPTLPTVEQQRERARAVTSHLVGNTIWPSVPTNHGCLEVFSLSRHFSTWTPNGCGYIHSRKLGRLVHYESSLEYPVFKALEHDPRVVGYQEQPLTIPCFYDDQMHHYTPDVAVHLDDGRVIIAELKPTFHLGRLEHWMRWASLSRYCERHGYGMFIGCPDRSILEHYLLSHTNEHLDQARNLIASEKPLCLDNPVVERLGYDPLHACATVDLLDWRNAGRGKADLKPATGTNRTQAEAFWALVASHAYARSDHDLA